MSDQVKAKLQTSGRDFPRILLVAYRYPPQGGVGAQRSAKFVKAWSRWGIPVSVVSGPEEGVRFSDPSLLPEKESDYFLTQAPDFSPQLLVRNFRRKIPKRNLWWALGRFLVGIQATAHQFSLPDDNLGWYLPAVYRTLREVRRFRPDVLFVSGPPWTPFLVAATVSRLTGVRLVLDYRDPWTASYIRPPLTWLRRRVNPGLERWVLSQACGVTAAHTAILKYLQALLSEDEWRSLPRIWIPNGYDPEDFAADITPAAERFLLTYTGSFFPRRSPNVLFQVLEELLADRKIDPDRFQLRLVGNVEFASKLFVQGSALAAVVSVEGYVSHSRTVQLMQESTANLVIEGDTGHGVNRTSPAKFYEALYAQRPVLLLCPDGTTTRLGRRTGGCWIAHPNDRQEIKRLMLELFHQWSRGGIRDRPRPERIGFYDRFHQARRVIRFLNRLSETDALAPDRDARDKSAKSAGSSRLGDLAVFFREEDLTAKAQRHEGRTRLPTPDPQAR